MLYLPNLSTYYSVENPYDPFKELKKLFKLNKYATILNVTYILCFMQNHHSGPIPLVHKTLKLRNYSFEF